MRLVINADHPIGPSGELLAAGAEPAGELSAAGAG